MGKELHERLNITSIFVNHFAAIVRIWHKLEPMRLNWVNSSSLLYNTDMNVRFVSLLEFHEAIIEMHLSSQLCLLLPLLPHPSLLLLQPHLLLVCLVPPDDRQG